MSTMRPSLFIWIPKTAGTSVWDACESATGSSLKVKDHPDCWLPEYTLLSFVHRSIEDLIRRGVLPMEEVERRFCFAFVRNPWDRLVSAFFYTRTHPYFRRVLRDLQLDTFDQFVRHITTEPIAPVGPYRYEELSFVNLQVDWLRGVELDFVGRFERLEESWLELCGKLGIGDVLLPHTMKTRHEHFATYYTDETRDMVARFYRDDIERFGYSFPTQEDTDEPNG